MRYLFLSLLFLSCSETPVQQTENKAISKKDIDVYLSFKNYFSTIPDSAKENYDEESLWIGFESGYNSNTQISSGEDLSDVVQKMEDEQDKLLETIEELKQENQRLLKIKTSIQTIMENE